ncbi:hypothetical protein RJ639_024960, partial [Escallonia herrerae]
ENSCGGHFGGQVTLHSTLKTPEQRTKAVGNVVKFLGEERIPAYDINQLYPVTSSFGTASYFPLERAAASYFGIKAYEVHMNGYVERDGQKYLWIAKRSAVKSNYPGMLDHLVAGGLPRDISSQKDLVKECEEEAGIPIIVADYAIPIGAVSYIDIDGCNYRRDVIFCYDLKLPECFIPKNQVRLILPKILKSSRPSPSQPSPRGAIRYTSSAALPPSSFTWDDVFRISQPQEPANNDLQGFFDRVRTCNRGSEKRGEFIPFVIEGQIVGYVHNGFADHLRTFKDVFFFPNDNSNGSHLGGHVTLHPMLKTPDHRTEAFDHVVKLLGKELIPGIRNELYPVASSFGTSLLFSLERAAAPYFGIKAYGVHMNGYVERVGEKYLWIGKRSEVKPTYPGMLDHLVAGGLPHDIACGENLVKECEEEAGIPKSIATRAKPVGAVSYMDINGYSYKRDVLFCYDLKLPESFVPMNQDGEVESFKLIPVSLVANVIQRTQFFKSNCNLVIIDFLFRHG